MESHEPVNVFEFQELAKQILPKIHYDYYSGGAEDQYTVKENVEAFQRIKYAYFQTTNTTYCNILYYI